MALERANANAGVGRHLTSVKTKLRYCPGDVPVVDLTAAPLVSALAGLIGSGPERAIFAFTFLSFFFNVGLSSIATLSELELDVETEAFDAEVEALASIFAVVPVAELPLSL